MPLQVGSLVSDFPEIAIPAYCYLHPETEEPFDVRYPELGEMFIVQDILNPKRARMCVGRMNEESGTWYQSGLCELDDIERFLDIWVRECEPEFVYFIGWG